MTLTPARLLPCSLAHKFAIPRGRWLPFLRNLPVTAGVLVGLVAAAVVTASGTAQAQEPPGRAVIVSLPTLKWEDVVEHQPPAILDVLEQSAAASTSVRTIGPTTTAGEAYVSIGAGNRSTVDTVIAGRAFEPSDPQSWGTAGEEFTNRTGYEVDDAAAVHLELPAVRRSASKLNYDADPGALGQAMQDADLSTAVVANADLPKLVHREAALAMMDTSGRVPGGTVSEDTLAPDRTAPFGSQLDIDATADAATDALGEHDAVLVEASDLARVDTYSSQMTSEVADEARSRAIDAADELVGRIASELDLERDLLILVGPTTGAGKPSELAMFAMAGPEIEPGVARSGSTRRDGYVALPDIAPTVLDYFGVDKPDAMSGNLITSTDGGAPTLSDAEDMAGTNEVTVLRDSAIGPTTVLFILLQLAVYALAIVAFVRGKTSGIRRAAMGGALWVMAIPVAGFLLGLVRYDKLGLGGFLIVLLATAAALAALAWLAFRWHMLGPPIAIAGFTLLVLLVDAVTGGWLQINTIFGYSPTVAGRFAGFGNLAFGVVAISAVTTAAGIWAWPRLSGPRGRLRQLPNRMGWPWWTAAAVLAVTLVVNGFPSWGSDVGGVLATTPSYAALLMLLAGLALSWRRMILLAAAAVVVLGIFAAIDLSRPESQRTHLARFVQGFGDGGAWTILGRKIDANISILTSSLWAWIVPIGILFLFLLLRRDPTLLPTLRSRVPGFQAWLIAAFMVGVLGMAVNDSGVAVPAIMMGIALPYLVYVGIKSEWPDEAVTP